jgi:hypothetical protein
MVKAEAAGISGFRTEAFGEAAGRLAVVEL